MLVVVIDERHHGCRAWARVGKCFCERSSNSTVECQESITALSFDNALAETINGIWVGKLHNDRCITLHQSGRCERSGEV